MVNLGEARKQTRTRAGEQDGQKRKRLKHLNNVLIDRKWYLLCKKNNKKKNRWKESLRVLPIEAQA